MELHNEELANWLESEAYYILKDPYNRNIDRLMFDLNREWFPKLVKLEERELERVVYRFCDDMLYEHKNRPFYLGSDQHSLNQHRGYIFSLFEHSVAKQKMDDKKTSLVLNIIHNEVYRLIQIPTNNLNKFKY